MDLVEIDIIQTEPAETGINCVPDMFFRGSALVRGVTRGVINFGCEDDLFAADSEFFQGVASDLLTGSVLIHVRRVKKIDSRVKRLLKERARLIFIQDPVPPF